MNLLHPPATQGSAMKSRLAGRRPGVGGFTLLEILVAIFILLIGVTTIMALFPIGTLYVREAVRDTRCTIVAQNAWQVIDAYDLADDPMFSDPGQTMTVASATPPDPRPKTYMDSWGQLAAAPPPIAGQFDDVQALTGDPADPTASVTPQTEAFGDTIVDPAAGGYGTAAAGTEGLPFLIDPLWVQQVHQGVDDIAGQTDPAVAAVGYNANRESAIQWAPALTATITTAGLQPQPVRVCTFSTAASIQDQGVRGAYLQSLFTDGGDVVFREDSPGLPQAPGAVTAGASLDDPFATAGAVQFPLVGALSPRQSSQRDGVYSWALMVQPNRGTRGVDDNRQALLVYESRNFAAYADPAGGADRVPYKACLGCFVDNDAIVTLRWTGDAPQLKRGGWLCQARIFNGAAAGDGDENSRRFGFHRVVEYEEVIDAAGTLVYVVQLERAPTGFDNQPYPGAAARTVPDPVPGGAGVARYYPVVVFDGLREVFDREGVWNQ